jgi:phytanoyl-CoA hydroxylase
MTNALRQEYEDTGFCIARGAIDPGLAGETVDHVHWLVEKNPEIRPERLHHSLLVDDPFMHRLVCDDCLVDIAEQFLGPNVAMFASHYIANKPGTGQAVQWHQDGSYWPLEPMKVTDLVGFAGTDSTVANGCMRVLPGTHTTTLLKRSEMVDLDPDKYVLTKGIHPDEIDDAEAVDLELVAGDVSIHHPHIIHGSNANTSNQWRVGLTLRYIPTSTKVKTEYPSIMCRGEVVPEVNNNYAPRPRYVEGEHMPFAGCGDWS